MTTHIPLPHAIVRCSDGAVTNLCSWDRVTEWQPDPGYIVVLLTGHVYFPQIWDMYNFGTKLFEPRVEAIQHGKVLLDFNGNALKTVKQQIQVAAPMAPPSIPPITAIDHRQINWQLCDKGYQSPLFFKPKAEAGEIYEDRMKIAYAEGFYAEPSTPEVHHG